MIHANPQLDIPLMCPRSLLNGDQFYQTIYQRSASQRGRPIDGLVTRLIEGVEHDVSRAHHSDIQATVPGEPATSVNDSATD